MVSFILNEEFVTTDQSAGMTLLDFIRNDKRLKGTKIGCREGDCGACAVLEGKLAGGRVSYQTIVSCLTPLGNAHGKHIVTVEGINMEKLSPVQEALVEHNGTQCGFCTPGFSISMSAFLLSDSKADLESAIGHIDGNICRCTGYKSIERAAADLVSLKKKMGKSNQVGWLTQQGFLPAYFTSIAALLANIDNAKGTSDSSGIIIGGGTDLMVQQPDEIVEKEVVLFYDNPKLKNISIEDGSCSIGAGVTASMIMESAELQVYFPKLPEHFKLIASTPIRNMGTVAGNLVNASPIGDLSIFFLVLKAKVHLKKADAVRTLFLNDFFLGYKKLDLAGDEYVEKVSFQLTDEFTRFNFEKVSKRTHLDIASVNSAISVKEKDGSILEAHLSAGGVSPVPLYLKETSTFLAGKPVLPDILLAANEIAQKEISPISDIRGSKEYKRLLLKQLIFTHFIELFPEKELSGELLTSIRT